MRAAASGKSSALVTAARGPALYATTTKRPRVRLVEVTNDGAADFAIGLARYTTKTSPGTGLTEISISDPSDTPECEVVNTHTADNTVGSPFRQIQLGAATGSGWVWTWEDGALVLDNSASDGIGFILVEGTAQHIHFTFEWDE